jgi:hypothetical protein
MWMHEEQENPGSGMLCENTKTTERKLLAAVTDNFSFSDVVD